ncbi:hypothetical protein RchiOBHm_Chr3g0469031 [Rosa chinensis]|uniref:Uncharacterized protein n=1 Tax=Rosa chinensis TaxID=74649 RepID=A0A2P6RAN6_ROSCH|nr:uncharacterized protein LOC112192467 [Rosa chinensis]PRQ43489.1 hypothetical protein RchiOBHm_Chr3g0469031 [Rosa chinensis]
MPNLSLPRFFRPYSWHAMELMKYSTFITIFLLFLLTTPYFARGGEISETVDSTTEVYEIDYRGPETHSSIPPPGHLHGKKKPLPNVIHKESVIGSPKSKRFRGGNYNTGRKTKTING